MKKTNSIIVSSIVFLVLFITVISCEEEKNDFQKVRLFRPVNPEMKTAGTWVAFEWDKIKDAVSYTAQASKDSFVTIDQTLEVDTNYVIFENLDETSDYYFRVMADAEDTVYSSHWAYFEKVWIGRIPSILKPQSNADVTDTSIIVRWDEGVNNDPPTKLIVTLNADDTVIQTIDLTNEDVVNQYKKITGLSSMTIYKITIYRNETSLGYELFVTSPST